MSDQRNEVRLPNQIDSTPRPGYCSHLGVLQGCMDRLGVDVDPAWLYGVTGYAFMINIPRGVCCSGPQAWDWHRICERTPDIGIDTSQYVLSNKKLPDFAEKKTQAIAFTRESFAAGVPLYGVEFGYPEFYMINGTSDEGFTFVHKYGQASTYRTWKDFGMMDVGILFVCAVRKSAGKADDRKAIVDALDFALAVGHASPGYLGTENPGLSAYDAWITGLADSAALKEGPWNHPDGTTYNAGAWHDCRTRAEQFLRMCPAKLGGKLKTEFARAADEYATVAAALGKVHTLFPYGMGGDLPSAEVVAESSRHLRAAREGESKGLELLEGIRKAL